MSLLEKNDILQKFQISSATLDNWVRTSIPEAFVDGLYNTSTIQQFVTEHNKLSKRANKKVANNIEIPKELFSYLEHGTDWISTYLEWIKNKNISVIAESLISLYQNNFNNHCELSAIIPKNELYAFSIAYQIALNSGEKSKQGSYYTPKDIVTTSIEKVIDKNKKMLEPCCGGGFFVIEYIKNYYKKYQCYPDNLIYINDIDEYAVKITELTIEKLTQGTCGYVSYNLDGLSLPLNHEIDIIITNPPYGIKQSYKMLKTTEIFSHFIHKALSDYIKPEGQVLYILPESILFVQKHAEIRQFMLENSFLKEIEYFGKAFTGVLSDIVSIYILNKKDHNTDILLKDKIGHKTLSQSSIVKPDYIISYINKDEQDYLKRIYSLPHITLNTSTFALGIVTGNNKKFITEEMQPNFVPFISGKDIGVGTINYDKLKYLLNSPEKYQQKPNMSFFKQKKIIYKFISNKIISAVDDKGLYTLNSANIILLDSQLEISAEYVSAILNSDIINKIFQQKFNSPIKILKGQLQEMPIFLFSKSIQEEIIEYYKLQNTEKINNIIHNEVTKLLTKG